MYIRIQYQVYIYILLRCSRSRHHSSLFFVSVFGDVRNFHLFLNLKKHLTGKKFDNDDEVQGEVMTWFIRIRCIRIYTVKMLEISTS